MVDGRGSYRSDPNASVAWLPPPPGRSGLAGAAFLVGDDIALTCAHSVRDHLGLGDSTPEARPEATLTLRFAALEQEVEAVVADCGWLPAEDIAVLTLAEPVDATCAAPANVLPGNNATCYVFGCPGDAADTYAAHGQIVHLRFRPALDGLSMHQLDTERDREIGYVVKPGFSGAPVFDELGNVVLAMVVRADVERQIALAVPAVAIRDALRAVRQCARQANRAEPRTADHRPGPVDAQAATALAAARSTASGIREISGVTPPEADLRGAFRRIAENARNPALTASASAALARAEAGDTAPLEEIFAASLEAEIGQQVQAGLGAQLLRRTRASRLRSPSLRSVDPAGRRLAAYRRDGRAGAGRHVDVDLASAGWSKRRGRLAAARGSRPSAPRDRSLPFSRGAEQLAA